MDQNKKKESSIWMILTCSVGIVFLILLWNMIPLNALIKIALYCFLIAFVFLIIVTFHVNLAHFNKNLAGWKATLVTAVIFLLVPSVMNLVYKRNADQYLISYPFDNVVAVKIECDVEHIGGSGTVGNEWSYIHLLNDTTFSSGDVIELGVSEPFTITSRIIEHDGISDEGETISKKYIYSKDENWKRNINFSQTVHVDERGGRRNAGAYADFRVEYTLARTFPKSITFWNLLFYAQNSDNGWLPVSLVVCELICVTIIVYVIVVGGKKEKIEIERIKQAERMAQIKRAEEEKLEKEKQIQRMIQIKLAEKESFIKSLDGKNIREVAKVPPNITFIDGLPKDSGEQKYGSYTLYVSSSGACYHKKSGCCSAHIPIHAFEIRRKYRPCSKCCTGDLPNFDVPKWYSDYIKLKKKCIDYGIDADE